MRAAPPPAPTPRNRPTEDRYPHDVCDTAVRLLDDGVLFAKNSDRDPNEGQALEWHAERTHDAGASLGCTWIEIDEVPRTNAVLLSRPFWMWGAEMGANSHGLVIGNEAVFTDQPYRSTGLTGMDLVRLALERAATAVDAVALIVDLIERHGQGGGCGHEQRDFSYHNSFLLADPTGAMVLETAGQAWAVERVTGPARSISNLLTIPSFAAAHQDRLRTRVAAARPRHSRTTARTAAATSPGDLMTMLRDHGPGRSRPRYRLVNGAMGAPCMHAGGLVANSQTTASWVADLRAEPRHWVTATAAPCTGLFKPVRLTEPVDLGSAPTDVADNSLWWRHERLHRRAVTDPVRYFPLFTVARETTELGWLADPPSGPEAFAEADRLLDDWVERIEAESARDRRPPWTRRYWRQRMERSRATVT
jgi:secernin